MIKKHAKAAFFSNFVAYLTKTFAFLFIKSCLFVESSLFGVVFLIKHRQGVHDLSCGAELSETMLLGEVKRFMKI